jgi:predicted RNA-binding Zn ribbon-like protein
MKNREQLPVGAKPAPGDLAFVQGFLNLGRFLSFRKDLDRVKILRDWMVRHGLMSSRTKVAASDLKTALELHDVLRSLLTAGSGGKVMPGVTRKLNRFVEKFGLSPVFGADGMARLEPSAAGVEKGLGMLLAVVVESIADGNWFRLKACNEDKCRWVFFDFSKNKSGRWCSMAVCGSRTKARSWRKRQKK